jgi:hypothetical protein
MALILQGKHQLLFSGILVAYDHGNLACTLVFGNRYTGATSMRMDPEIHPSIMLDLLSLTAVNIGAPDITTNTCCGTYKQ